MQRCEWFSEHCYVVAIGRLGVYQSAWWLIGLVQKSKFLWYSAPYLVLSCDFWSVGNVTRFIVVMLKL